MLQTLHASRLIHKAGEVGGWELQHKAKALVFKNMYVRVCVYACARACACVHMCERV